VFGMGAVAYANASKEELLEAPELLSRHGAVSEPVARAMAEGARRKGGATWGLAITGLAGPTGGTPEKPIGLVYLAITGPAGTRSWERRFFGHRERIRKTATYDALNELRLMLR
jgi:nicotinamide-nucleotide amidase